MIKQTDWERFLERSELNVHEYPSLHEVISALREFLWPVVLAAVNNMPFDRIWNAGGLWDST